MALRIGKNSRNKGQNSIGNEGCEYLSRAQWLKIKIIWIGKYFQMKLGITLIKKESEVLEKGIGHSWREFTIVFHYFLRDPICQNLKEFIYPKNIKKMAMIMIISYYN